MTSALTTIPIPTAESLGWPVTISIARGGEDEGRMLLAQFTEGSGAPIHAYARRAISPASRDQPPFAPSAIGTVSVRTALAAAHAAMLEEGQTGGAAGPAAWVRERPGATSTLPGCTTSPTWSVRHSARIRQPTL